MTVLSSGFALFATGAALLGVGTAMVYPTLLAAIGDVAHPSWRASSVGVYPLWRDLGYAIGALLVCLTAAALGLPAAPSAATTPCASRRAQSGRASSVTRTRPGPSGVNSTEKWSPGSERVQRTIAASEVQR